MPQVRGVFLSAGAIVGISFISAYRFLTIGQFARAADFSMYHAGELLRRLEQRGFIGHFGGLPLPGQGRAPKVYFLKRKGWEILRNESDLPEETIGPFVEVNREVSWSPQMYHRLRLLDLFIALETQVRNREHLQLVQTFIEYRRLKGSHIRETTDFVTDRQLPEDRIVPDGAFILTNQETGRTGLFLLEMDMGSERVEAPKSADQRATIKLKLSQYDKYLTSGRFATKYAAFGDFRLATILFVTYGQERITTIRKAARTLSPQLHGYYRFTEFADAAADFLGPVWQSRDLNDSARYALVQQT